MGLLCALLVRPACHVLNTTTRAVPFFPTRITDIDNFSKKVSRAAILMAIATTCITVVAWRSAWMRVRNWKQTTQGFTFVIATAGWGVVA